MTLNEDAQATLAAVERFFRQQHELSGNIIYREQGSSCLQDRQPVAEVERDGILTSGPINQPSIVHESEGEALLAKQTKRTAVQASAAAGRASAEMPVRAGASKATCAELWDRASSLEELNEYIRTCADCPLEATRTKFVFGVGPSNAGAMVIGEAPGADEDAQGEPFVGRAGQLLNKILESIRFRREDVFIANILKCRPPNNRRPLPSEVEHCEPYLWKQIELIKPKIILCLGLTAAQTLLKTTASLGVLRESTQEYRGIPLVVTYHPAALLRNPNWKRPTWEDVKKFRKLFDELV